MFSNSVHSKDKQKNKDTNNITDTLSKLYLHP